VYDKSILKILERILGKGEKTFREKPLKTRKQSKMSEEVSLLQATRRLC